MLIYFFIIFSLYYILIGVIYAGWSRGNPQKSRSDANYLPFVSVVIAVRNEAKIISKLINCLIKQSYPKDRFEVIFINDQSEDDTETIIEKLMNQTAIDFRLIQSNYVAGIPLSPKKNALLKGIGHAKGEILALTDGDCWFEKNWLYTIISPFKSELVQFISGPVVLEGNNDLFSKIQTIEFSSLMGTGGAMINLNYPLMCNGANLGIRKSAFIEVNGYDGNMENASGDDVFLMQKIHKAFPRSIRFIKDQDAIVSTSTQENITALMNQRRRWASKWNKYQLSFSWALPVFLFIHYISFIASLIFLFPSFVVETTIMIIIKIALDYLLLNNFLTFSKHRISIYLFLICEILYPFYAVYFGLASQVGSYRWKGRSHNI
jgi:cellulose synthase/poly-beta-1,6-N-acetylglucosamine synthase-like glycosyltransferase